MRLLTGLTAARLRFLFHYNPETGRWTVLRVDGGTGNPRQPGQLMPRRKYRGGFEVDGQKYVTSRLAWLYMTGEWPALDVDHANGDPTDDRWENLRHATRRQNNGNAKKRRDNTSGIKGVHWDRERKKWFVAINDAVGHRRALGRYKSLEEARLVYEKASVALFGEFARHD